MKKVLSFICMGVLATWPTYGVEEDLKAEIERYFELGKVQEKYEVAMVEGFKVGAGMADTDGMPAEQRAKMEKGLNRVQKLLLEEMGWEKVKDDMMELYEEVFSATELKEINAFLEEPAIQKMVEAEIKLIPIVMAFSQEKTKALVPRIQSIMMEEMSK